MDNIILLLVLFIALELFESSWQKADTMYGVLKNNYTIYKKSIFLFFLLNITFIYTLYLLVTLEEFYNSTKFIFWMSTIVCMKFLDIIFKLYLFKKIETSENIQQLLPVDIKVGYQIRYINVIIYPIMFYFGTLF